MPEIYTTFATPRLAIISRAAVEGHRYKATQRAQLDSVCDQTIGKMPEKERPARLEEIKDLIPATTMKRDSGGGVKLGEQGLGGTAELMKQRASLELKLRTESEQRQEVEQAYAREQNEHREGAGSPGLTAAKAGSDAGGPDKVAL